MLHQQIIEAPNQNLLVGKDLLDQAGLRGQLKVIIRLGEIRIVPAVERTAKDLLDGLAGCLGRESAADYDFGLKLGGLYEAR